MWYVYFLELSNGDIYFVTWALAGHSRVGPAASQTGKALFSNAQLGGATGRKRAADISLKRLPPRPIFPLEGRMPFGSGQRSRFGMRTLRECRLGLLCQPISSGLEDIERGRLQDAESERRGIRAKGSHDPDHVQRLACRWRTT